MLQRRFPVLEHELRKGIAIGAQDRLQHGEVSGLPEAAAKTLRIYVPVAGDLHFPEQIHGRTVRIIDHGGLQVVPQILSGGVGQCSELASIERDLVVCRNSHVV